jgi:hypothetical protein
VRKEICRRLKMNSGQVVRKEMCGRLKMNSGDDFGSATVAHPHEI